MSERLLYGNDLARQMMAEVADEVRQLGLLSNYVHFATVLVGDNPASQRYIAMKQGEGSSLGIEMSRVDVPANISQDGLEEEISNLSDREDIDAILVQYPLPPHLDYLSTIQKIDPRKDVDGLHPSNLGLLLHDPENFPGLIPCTPKGILQLLQHGEVAVERANITIVGKGLTVGAPLAALLTSKKNGPYATVTTVHRGTKDLTEHLVNADIVVAAAGQPALISGEMIRDGATLVSVGVTYDKKGMAHGDFSDDAREKAGVFVPVTKGVGPMTRANLWKNAIRCYELTSN